jgi:hypothetical protein
MTHLYVRLVYIYIRRLKSTKSKEREKNVYHMIIFYCDSVEKNALEDQRPYRNIFVEINHRKIAERSFLNQIRM